MSNEASGISPESPTKFFGVTDAIFVVLAIFIGIMVAYLGYVTFREGANTEITKLHGEKLSAWLEQHGAERAEGKAGEVHACDAKDAVWKDCIDALHAVGGPFADITNVNDKNGKLFAAACDHNDPDSHGAIILEKGVAKAAPNSGFDYAPIADNEPLKDLLPIRVSICGRAFSVIRIKEVLF